MPNYRRVRVPGGTYFFTVNLQQRDRALLVEHMESLRNAFRCARGETFSNHRGSGPARSFALHLAFAARRCRLCNQVAAHQVAVFAFVSGQRFRFSTRGTVRTWNLATAILGTLHPRRTRSSRAHRIRSLQPGEARVRERHEGMAVFDDSPGHTRWRVKTRPTAFAAEPAAMKVQKPADQEPPYSPG